MAGFMKALAKAAKEKLTPKPPRAKKRDCHPELKRLVACGKIALEQDDEEEVKRSTELPKRRARIIRTEEQMNKFQGWEWDLVKYYKWGCAKMHEFTDRWGRTVNDRMGPETCANYFENVQWAQNLEIDQQEHEEPVPMYDTEAEVNQSQFTREELDKAIATSKNNKTPGPNRVMSGSVKLLDEEGKNKLLELLNKCWEGEELYEDMNQADLAVIYVQKGTHRQT